MKYRNRVVTTVSFEGVNLKAFKDAARDANMDFSQWVNAQCARAVKRDNRTPGNRTRKTEGEK